MGSINWHHSCLQDAEDSGLDELWAAVYAQKSIPKMFDGKSYTKNLRACLTQRPRELVLHKDPASLSYTKTPRACLTQRPRELVLHKDPVSLSYTKTLRACLLTNAALRVLLLRPKAGAEAKDEDDEEDGSEET